ncbi:putative glycerol-3-phosphate acyltransferase 3 [Curcuma longa]|uniref:putative glycerol-3-phosphate acyltransferase 3 n=1 Tax=Curcuma longa TaxID=136217 RepID=UPI003D9F8753
MTSKTFKSFYLFYRFLARRLRAFYANHGKAQRYPPTEKLRDRTVVFDVEEAVLRDRSTFPYFMLVAVESGGLLRGMLLLILYPAICCLGKEAALRMMAMVAFCGLREKAMKAGRAVLPKFLMEDVGEEGWEVVSKARRRVAVSCMPTVMVEPFAKEYLGAEKVVAREMRVVAGYYTGWMKSAEEELQVAALFGKEKRRKEAVVGFGGSGSFRIHHNVFAHCEEVYFVSTAEKRRWRALPRCKYPKPVVFHDGRLAFKPIASSAAAMFFWLPFALLLAVARAVVFILLPYALSIPLVAVLGMHNRVIISSSSGGPVSLGFHDRLFICNHRTLLDPLCISAALGRPVTAATYSISRVTEWISPIRTVRLTRNRDEDLRLMRDLVDRGKTLVVCPEGTTCREPYLLRFSPLFAEVNADVVPVAIETAVSMFYGTSTTGRLKSLDPLYFLLNPIPSYDIQFMNRVATGTIAGRECSSRDMANYLQTEIGRLLGFECTAFTRKDKYLMLAGNEGFSQVKK